MSESQHLEWKSSWHDDNVKSVCGFANAEGGMLVVGRDDDGVVVGLIDAHRLLEELPNKMRDLLGIMVDVNLRTEAGLDYLEILAPAYPNPISYRGEYYYRSGSTNQVLKGAGLDQFLLRKQGRHWDGVPVPGFTMLNLSHTAVASFRRRAARSGRVSLEVLSDSDDVLLDKLRLTEHGLLKRAALLLFLDEPERLVTGAYVKIGFFRTDSDLLYHDEIHGDLFTQVDRVLDLLLTKYLRAGIKYSGLQRMETYPVPEAALREVVINAIAHKDYASKIPIQISVYDSKLMIWNPGQLPPRWTLDELTAKHASVPHNPDVVSVFFRSSLLEAWGRGIDLIRNACREHGTPPPKFRWDNGLWVELPFKQVELSPESGREKTLQKTGQITGQITGQKTGQKTLQKQRPKTPEVVLEILSATPNMSLHEVAILIGKSRGTVAHSVGELIRSGRLKRIGPDKGGHWKVIA